MGVASDSDSVNGRRAGTAPVAAGRPEWAGHRPVPLTAIVGREREAAALRGLLVRPTARLVTLTGIGVRMPAHLTASGRAMLAHLPAAQVRALFPSTRAFVNRTGEGPTSLPELRRVLQKERRQGWAEEVGLITPGLQSVAACAFDHTGHPVAAFSVTRRQQGSHVPATELVRAVQTAAQQLTSALSGRPPEGWNAPSVDSSAGTISFAPSLTRTPRYSNLPSGDLQMAMRDESVLPKTTTEFGSAQRAVEFT